jgi:hypothetical protein
MRRTAAESHYGSLVKSEKAFEDLSVTASQSVGNFYHLGKIGEDVSGISRWEIRKEA